MPNSAATTERFGAERADEIRRRLRAIEGQVRGVSKMIDDDRPCLETLMQVSAAQEALSQVGKLVTRNYMEKCLSEAIRTGTDEERARAYDDLMDVIYKYRR